MKNRALFLSSLVFLLNSSISFATVEKISFHGKNRQGEVRVISCENLNSLQETCKLPPPRQLSIFQIDIDTIQNEPSDSLVQFFSSHQKRLQELADLILIGTDQSYLNELEEVLSANQIHFDFRTGEGSSGSIHFNFWPREGLIHLADFISRLP